MTQQSTEPGFSKQGLINVDEFDSIKPMKTTIASISYYLWKIPMGEENKDALRLVLARKLKLEFTGSRSPVILAYWLIVSLMRYSV
jgi:hypothetical protein